MTAGFFNYNQFIFEDIANELKEITAMNTKGYSDKVIEDFQSLIEELMAMKDKVHAVDLLLSEDSDEEEFLESWDEI